MDTVRQNLTVAIGYLRNGKVAQAQEICNQILAQDAKQADALYLLGQIAQQAGKHDAAADYFARAAGGRAKFAEAYFNQGMSLKAAGRLDEAIAAYRQAVGCKADFVEALGNLGNALREKGQFDEALAVYRQVVTLRPRHPLVYNNLGAVLNEQGQFAKAIAAFRQALALKNDWPEVHCNLGGALLSAGQVDAAIAAYRRAVVLKSDFAEAHFNLGMALLKGRQLLQAAEACKKAIALRDVPEFECGLGGVLMEMGQIDDAIAAFRKATIQQPSRAQSHNSLASALMKKEQFEEAIESYRRAIALDANFAEAYSNLSYVLRRLGRVDEAIEASRRAIALKADLADAHERLGAALYDKGEVDQAIASCQRAIELHSDHAAAHLDLGMALLSKGDFARGWKEYEWRWEINKNLPGVADLAADRWDGSPLNGRTILVHAEQGFGDTLQFIRYVPMVVQRGGKVVIACVPVLRRLLGMMEGGYTVASESVPACEVSCSLMSLPAIFGTTLETVPRKVPYLRADSRDITICRERIAEDTAAGRSSWLKVGLVWAGQTTHKQRIDRNRALSPDLFVSLGQIKGVQFINLVKDTETLGNGVNGLEMIDFMDEVEDFADTAALVASMDLIISVDTAVAHLAGALGKPVWTLLPFVADWRWLRDRDDSPWYPTMRLFRQKNLGDWDGVMREITAALTELARRR